MSPSLSPTAHVLALCLYLGSLPGHAATPLEDFNSLMSDAYSDYRAALFQTNNGERESAQASLVRFQQRWRALADRFGTAPPEVYAGDPDWQATLNRVAQIADDGRRAIEEGDIGGAHEMLEAIRDELGQLRARNEVYTFSDAVNAYHAVMEAILAQKISAEQLNTAARNRLREQLGTLRYLAGEMRARAPTRYRDRPEFQPMLQALFDSLEHFGRALDSDEPDQLLKSIKGLKPPYAKLFLKFG